jgi:3-dehydroquinate dehydratase-1
MLDVARGPLLVGVASGPAALARCAATPPPSRIADVVEARLDLFPAPTLEPSADACRALESSGTPVLVTLRAARQGGRSQAPDAERLANIRAALALASWVDIEDDASIVTEVAALAASRNGQLVVSHHDFERTPPLDELLRLADRCRPTPGAIAKIATAVRGDADREALFALLAKRPQHTCVIGMGAAPELRIELPARGSLLAYGYLDEATAPGQLSVAETDSRLRLASPAYAARKHARG